MELRLDGKNALVTGASSGLGWRFATALVSLVFADRAKGDADPPVELPARLLDGVER